MDKLNLSQKLVSIYRELDHIEKTGINKTQKYAFVRSADVLREVRKAFAKYNIYAQTNFTSLGTYDIKTNSGGNMHVASVRAEITLFDADSNETKVVSGLGDGADVGDKGIYKAQTGAVKNALRNALLLPDEADPEADETVDIETEETRILPKPKILDVPLDTSEIPSLTIPTVLEGRIPDNLSPIGGYSAEHPSYPNEVELDKYRKKIQALTEELTTSGALKASRSTPISRKILMYLLNTAGVSEAKQISVSQWTQILNFIDTIKTTEDGLNKLGKLIDNASKESKEKK